MTAMGKKVICLYIDHQISLGWQAFKTTKNSLIKVNFPQYLVIWPSSY